MTDEMPAPVKSSGASKCLIGCLIVAVVFVVVAVIGGVYVYRNFRAMAADAMHDGFQQTVEQSQLPEDQKRGIMAEIGTFRDDIKSGKVGMQEIAFVMREVGESPLMPIMTAWGVESQHIKPSGLSEEEKKDANLQIQRFSRGLMEKKLSEDDSEAVIEPIKDPRSDPNFPQPKQSLTDDELRKFIAAMKAKADAASVPNEPYQPDIAGELKRVIDKALGRSSGTTPTPTPAPPSTEPAPAEPPAEQPPANP